jgi:hypothetical protein
MPRMRTAEAPLWNCGYNMLAWSERIELCRVPVQGCMCRCLCSTSYISLGCELPAYGNYPWDAGVFAREVKMGSSRSPQDAADA